MPDRTAVIERRAPADPAGTDSARNVWNGCPGCKSPATCTFVKLCLNDPIIIPID